MLQLNAIICWRRLWKYGMQTFAIATQRILFFCRKIDINLYIPYIYDSINGMRYRISNSIVLYENNVVCLKSKSFLQHIKCDVTEKFRLMVCDCQVLSFIHFVFDRISIVYTYVLMVCDLRCDTNRMFYFWNVNATQTDCRQ